MHSYISIEMSFLLAGKWAEATEDIGANEILLQFNPSNVDSTTQV